MRPGVVTFVSLGPGDPALRTSRAVARCAEADVVVVDDEADVAKLVALAHQGRHVVRAVSGDALESERVVSEAVALADAGVAVEVVPGVSAGAAAAAFAGVRAPASWMRPAEVSARLGVLDPSAPVTFIFAVGSAAQRVLVTTAGAAQGEARGLADEPFVLALGAPVPALAWFERQPLFGRRVLVTRASSQAASAATLLCERGAEPRVVPTIEFRPPRDPAPLLQALTELRGGGYDWVAFTSANGVEKTWEALASLGADTRAFGRARVAAIGPATARAVEARGLRPDVVAAEFRGEQLAIDMIGAFARQTPNGPSAARVLVARAAKARDALPDALRAAGCWVDVVAAYETHAPSSQHFERLARELELGRIDAVLFTSSSTVENLCDRLGPGAAGLLRTTRVASIGPITTATATARGLRIDVTAAVYTVPALVDALAESYRADAAARPP